jgi:hypothetical protein
MMYLKLRKTVNRAFAFATALIFALVTFVFSNSAVAQLNVPVPPTVRHPPHLPEGNTGLVLIPIVIAVMLVSSLQLFGKRAVQKQ